MFSLFSFSHHKYHPTLNLTHIYIGYNNKVQKNKLLAK